MPEIRAATLEELKAVRHSLEDLRRVMPEQVKEEVAKESMPRAEVRARLRRNFWRTILIAVVVVLVAVGINRITLLQAGQDFSEAVTTCFLRPAAITDAQVADCDAKFGENDHTYLRLQEQSKKATADFVSLRKWAKENGWQPPQ